MAGSYSHIHSESAGDGRGIALIENLADARQCIEELYFLVRVLGTDRKIKAAISEFSRLKRGESGNVNADVMQAWLESQKMME